MAFYGTVQQAAPNKVVSVVPGVWVQLVGGGVTFTSDAPTDSGGNYAMASANVTTGVYEVYTSSNVAGPWTDTGEKVVVNSADATGTVHLAGTETITGIKTFAADAYFESGRPWFDACAFGADPTGVIDSTSAINLALATATGKGVTFIPYGTYVIAGTIVVPSNSTLMMTPATTLVQQSGSGTAIKNQNNTPGGSGDTNIQIFGGNIVLASGATGSVHVNFGQITGFRLSGLTMSGANSGTAEAVVGNNLYQAQIDNLNIDVYDSSGVSSCNGIWLRGGNGITVSDCVVQSGDDAYAFSSASTAGFDDLRNVSISNCFGDSRRGRVLDIESGVNNTYQISATGLTGRANSGVDGLDSDCIAIVNDNQSIATVHDISVSNCVIDSSNAMRGIHIDGVYNVNVSNIVLSGTIEDAVILVTTTAGNTTSTKNIRVSNVIGSTSGATWAVAYVAPASGGTVTNAEFIGCQGTSAGYGANFNSASGAISGCTLRDCNFAPAASGSGRGLYVHGTSGVSHCIFEGNHLNGGWSSSIEEDSPSTNNLYLNNDLTGYASHPVFSTGQAGSAFRGNLGLNPFGALTGTIFPVPTMPGSTVNYTNTTGLDCFVLINCGAGVSVSAIKLSGNDGVSTTLTGVTVAASSTSIPIPVRVGEIIQLTYTGGTPTWQWFGD